MPVPPRPGSLKDPEVSELFEREVSDCGLDENLMLRLWPDIEVLA